MNLFGRIIAQLAANGIGLYLAHQYIEGFKIIPLNLKEFLLATLVLTFINFFVRPILKVVLSPIILITLGVALIAINGLTLYILTILVPAVTISGIQPLVYAALLTTAVNIIAKLLP